MNASAKYNNKILKKVICIAVIFGMIGAFFAVNSPKAEAETKITLPSHLYTDAAYYIYIATTNEEIASYNSTEVYNIASISKLMTCLIAAEKLNMDDYYSVQDEEEKVSVKELMYRALLPSDSNAAAALGVAVSGSREEFIILMNDRAKMLGCKNTTFNNASGLYGYNKSTCEDVVKIAKAAFANETVKSICEEANYILEESTYEGSHELINTNYFLEGGTYKATTGKTLTVEEYPEVNCGKTGTTEEGYATMVVQADFYGLECYVVLLRSTWDYRYDDMKKLLDYTRESITPFYCFNRGQKLQSAKVWGGATNTVMGVAGDNGVINLPEGTSKALTTYEVTFEDHLTAPIEKGATIGEATIYLAGEKIRTINIVAAESVEKGWFLSGLRITNQQTIYIFIGLFFVLGLFVAVLLIRRYNIEKRKRMRRQRIIAEARRQMADRANRDARNWPYK